MVHVQLQQNHISSSFRPGICGILSSTTSVLSVADSYFLFSLGCPSLTEMDERRSAEISHSQNWVNHGGTEAFSTFIVATLPNPNCV